MSSVRFFVGFLLASVCACADQGSSAASDAGALGQLDAAESASEPSASTTSVVDATNPNLIGLGERASEPAAACSWTLATCGPHAQPIEVTGQTPFGPIVVRSVGVRYWVGFTYDTELRLEGMVGDAPLLLTARVSDDVTDNILRPQVLPGTYRNGGSWTDLVTRALTCQLDVSFEKSVLKISEHDFGDAGTAHIAGELIIAEEGWSLAVPFDIHDVCREPVGGTF